MKSLSTVFFKTKISYLKPFVSNYSETWNYLSSKKACLDKICIRELYLLPTRNTFVKDTHFQIFSSRTMYKNISNLSYKLNFWTTVNIWMDLITSICHVSSCLSSRRYLVCVEQFIYAFLSKDDASEKEYIKHIRLIE